MTKIKVVIDADSGKLSVWNNGKGIPCQIHKEYNIYVAELIFGHLLTSSNYDDSEKKIVGGRNGFGAKLANIFSSKFVIEAADTKSGKLFKQTYEKNMSKRGEPIIKEYSGKDDYTFVTFWPDYERFGMSGLDKDTIKVLSKRVFDIAGVLPSTVHVTLNGEKIDVKNFESYIDLYLPPKESGDGPIKIYEKVNNRWEIGVSVSDGQFQQVSFVNGICTIKGGTHVNHVTDQIVDVLTAAIKKKHKMDLKPHQVKSHLWIFVNSLIENPAFDSQTKETLTLKPASFGSSCTISQAVLKRIMKCGLIEVLVAVAQAKDQATLLKQLNAGKIKKSHRLLGIDKLEDANWAGSKRSNECLLIVTEGDSAKSLAMVGVEVVGRDRFGVFPLRGKMLNVRNANNNCIRDNQEIQDLIKIMGLQVGTEYTDTKGLRYGGLMIMADQDVDGSHIKGLVINFFHAFWPSLWKKQGFLSQFITPIIKATKGHEVNQFFTIPEYENWAANKNLSGYKIKYYKGLGTSTSNEAKEYFKNIAKHKIEFKYQDDEDANSIIMAFGKKNAEQRKDWLNTYQDGTHVDYSKRIVRYKNFVDEELILFSMYDNMRSIPSVCDGLKPAQRKILFACFKRNLKNEIKVAQLSGYIAEQTGYHHGEDSLSQAIIGMAQNFVGSNNINLLQPIGQFGSRHLGGKEAASPRYLYTALSKIARYIFREEDDALLKYQIDEGQKAEPEFYLPIIPMILVNGSDGIGTGWRSTIPNYNPREIVSILKKKMRAEQIGKLLPWFKNYEGVIIESDESNGFLCYGRYRIIDDNTLEIIELPIRRWTRDYKTFLEESMEGYDKVAAKIEAAKAKNKAKGKKGKGRKLGAKSEKKKKEDKKDTPKKSKKKRSGKSKKSDSESESGSNYSDEEEVREKKPSAKKEAKTEDSQTDSKSEIKIEDIKEYHRGNSIRFVVKMKKEYMDLLKKKLAEDDGDNKVMKALKLVCSIPKTQFVCFDTKTKLKRYQDANEIIDEYYTARLELYKKRKIHQLEELKRELSILDNKLRFVTEVINGKINVFRKKKANLVSLLHSSGYAKNSDLKAKSTSQDKLLARLEAENSENESDSEKHIKASEYDYLLGMPMWSLSEEKVAELEKQKAEKEKQAEELEKLSEMQMWERDLDEFLEVLDEIEHSEQKANEKATQSLGHADKNSRFVRGKKKVGASHDIQEVKYEKPLSKSDILTSTKPMTDIKPKSSVQKKSEEGKSTPMTDIKAMPPNANLPQKPPSRPQIPLTQSVAELRGPSISLQKPPAQIKTQSTAPQMQRSKSQPALDKNNTNSAKPLVPPTQNSNNNSTQSVLPKDKIGQGSARIPLSKPENTQKSEDSTQNAGTKKIPRKVVISDDED